MYGLAGVNAMMELQKRTPLLQMTPDELVMTYMTPLTLGVFFSFLFYGMFILSAYLYFTQFQPDTWINRSIVAILVCLATADTVSGGVRIFRMTVLHPNNLAYVLDVTQRPEDWLASVFLFFTVLVSQSFMCWRIVSFARHISAWNETPEGAKKSRRKVWGQAVGLGVGWIACLGAVVANMCVFYRTTNYMQLLVPTAALARIFRVTTLVLPMVFFDLLIAVLLTLQYRKARTGFGVSNHILGVLMNVIIRNGAMTACVMLAQLLATVLAVLWGNFLPLFYGKLHALTVVAVLTEPRLAKAEWFRSQESSRPSASVAAPRSGSGRIDTPHMDFTRPSQFSVSVSPLESLGNESADLEDEVKTPGLSSEGSIGILEKGNGGATNKARKRRKYEFAPVNPTCAHCHMPWLPSDLDTRITVDVDTPSTRFAPSLPTPRTDSRNRTAARPTHVTAIQPTLSTMQAPVSARMAQDYPAYYYDFRVSPPETAQIGASLQLPNTASSQIAALHAQPPSSFLGLFKGFRWNSRNRSSDTNDNSTGASGADAPAHTSRYTTDSSVEVEPPSTSKVPSANASGGGLGSPLPSQRPGMPGRQLSLSEFLHEAADGRDAVDRA